MGLIEDSIFAIYRKALEEGDIKQAKKAVELASILKQKIENEGFVDRIVKNESIHSIPGSFFKPFPYRYYQEEGVVVFGNSAVSLTTIENRLFLLFASNESTGNNLRIITKKEIRQHLWADKSVSPNTIRITILRLRQKIDVNKKSPHILVSIYSKGYVFFGERIPDNEQNI